MDVLRGVEASGPEQFPQDFCEQTRTGLRRLDPGAIQRDLSRGDFEHALAAGVLLVCVALALTLASHFLTEEKRT